MFGKDKVLPDTVAGPPVEAAATPIILDGPVVLDLSQVRDELIPEGWHTVTVERADPGLSRQQQIPKIFILSRVTDEGDPDHNRTIIWNVMLSGDGMQFMKRCFAALGLPLQLNYPSYQALADDLIGREVEVKLKHKAYKGEKQVNVSNWRPCTAEITF